MLNGDLFSRIITVFDEADDRSNNSLYRDAVKNILLKALSTSNHSISAPTSLTDFFRELPIVRSTTCKEIPGTVSFFFVAKYRSGSSNFFFDMISRWLVPGKTLSIGMIYAANFLLPDLTTQKYTVCEMMIRVDTQEELEQIHQNLPIIETEIKLGVESSYYARRIMEIKGLTADAKTGIILEHIAYLSKRRPKDFDQNLLTEMQHVLVMSKDEFKTRRSSRHLCRLICYHYLFHKEILARVQAAPEQRHLSLKIFKSSLLYQGKTTPILSVVVGLNFLKDKEIFEKRHLLAAIQNHIPSAKVVEHSFFANRRGNESISTLYLEVEKPNGEGFSQQEMTLLRKELPRDLSDRIEHLMHPVFMPPNEEEIMRNILSLSSQIRFLRDLPQVFISFDEQTHADLYFTVILVKVVRPGEISTEELFKDDKALYEYTLDRCKTVGILRKKYIKEATVFRVRMFKDQFLRRDHSIDLYKARQALVRDILSVIGEFRDFNGGMISKQNESLSALREVLENDDYNDLLLESFFYSMNPVIMRHVLPPETLRKLFLMLRDAINWEFGKSVNSQSHIEAQDVFLYVMIKARQRTIKDDMNKLIESFNFQSSDVATSYVHMYEAHYLGYILRIHDSRKRQQISEAIQALSGASEGLASTIT